MSIKLSERASQLIAQALPSVASLEMLLLLRESPDRDWMADDVAARLRLTPAALPEQFDELASRGLIEVRPGRSYRYRPRTPEIRAAVDEVATAYRDQSHTVIAQIHG